jgi:peptidoglycan/xylan/chitin deacetylase (PgdA/CDA1 family)
MSAVLKRSILRVLTNPLVLPLLERLSRHRATILMCHRFEHRALGTAGHSPAALAASLEWLRRRRYHIAPLGDLVDALLGERPLPPRTVVFTVDDGYQDFGDIAAPVFARYDCPVTVFLATGFIDRTCWLWWDQVEYAFRSTTRASLELAPSGEPVRLQWDSEATRDNAVQAVIEMLKRLPRRERIACFTAMLSQLDVALPDAAPQGYAPMTWDAVRTLGRQGVTFGPHTVTHPILSRVPDDQAQVEIAESWARVRAETDAAIPVFCYPNGDPDSFGPREVAIVRRTGLRAALTTIPGQVARQPVTATSEPLFSLPRYAYSTDLPRLAQAVSGLEMLKGSLR